MGKPMLNILWCSRRSVWFSLGRFVAALTLAIAIVLAGITYFPESDYVAVGPVPPPEAVYVVKGDTAWSIAQRWYPEEYSTWRVVEKMRELNPHLDLDRLQVDDRLTLPTLEELEVIG